MRKDGIAVISRTTLVPAIVTSSKTLSYPDDAIGEIKKHLDNVLAVDADKIAAELGNPRLVNTILLGIVSNHLPFAPEIWTDSLKSRVKARFVDINLRAFERGREIKLNLINA
jgi:indolepyruvate ferredoxin oxidoreductase beta subunit